MAAKAVIIVCVCLALIATVVYAIFVVRRRSLLLQLPLKNALPAAPESVDREIFGAEIVTLPSVSASVGIRTGTTASYEHSIPQTVSAVILGPLPAENVSHFYSMSAPSKDPASQSVSMCTLDPPISGVNPQIEAFSANGELRGPDPPEQLHRLVMSLGTCIRDRQIVIHGMLGSGANGVVYRGEWRGLPVAIKTLSFHSSITDRQHQRVLMEAAISANLSNMFIVTTYAYEITPQHPLQEFGYEQEPMVASSEDISNWRLCIVQEFCDGGTLTAAIDRHDLKVSAGSEAMDLLRVLEAAEGIATGMDHIHSKNIVHGDLNPNNILLKRCADKAMGFIVKVADFGLSIRLVEGQSHISNICQGTPNYVAPEVLQSGKLSKAADVFSFGVLLWELMAGEAPWRHKRFPSYPAPHRTLLSEFPEYCPKEYKELTERCLELNDFARPTFDEVILVLQRLKYSMISNKQD